MICRICKHISYSFIEALNHIKKYHRTDLDQDVKEILTKEGDC